MATKKIPAMKFASPDVIQAGAMLDWLRARDS